MCDSSDDELLERARGGDETALANLLMRHGPSLRQRLDINPKWQSVLEPEDVMQVTYLDAVDSFQQFEGSAKQFPGWLWRIARNNLLEAIKELERQKRPHPDKRIESRGSDSLAYLYEALTAGGTTPTGKVTRQEIREILNGEVASLAEDYRNVLQLRYFQELEFNTIAKQMDRSYGAVVLLHLRAREKLREKLGTSWRYFSR